MEGCGGIYVVDVLIDIWSALLICVDGHQNNGSGRKQSVKEELEVLYITTITTKRGRPREFKKRKFNK